MSIRDFPKEIHDTIKSYLTDEEEDNFNIVLKDYTIIHQSKYSCDIRVSNFRVTITDNGSGYFQTPGVCYASCTKKPIQAFIDGGFFPKGRQVIECLRKYKPRFIIRKTLNPHDSRCYHLNQMTTGVSRQIYALKLIHILDVDKKPLIPGYDDISNINTDDWKIDGTVEKNYFGAANFLPVEVCLKISEMISDERDQVNWLLASKCFSRQGTTIHIMNQPMYSVNTAGRNFPNGFCYLSTLQHKMCALLSKGIFLRTTELLNTYKQYGLNCDKVHYSGVDVKYGHISDQASISSKVVKLVNNDKTHSIPLNMDTISLINSDNWKPTINHEFLGTTGGFDLTDILNSQPVIVGYHCPEPEVYVSQGKRIQEPQVTLHHEIITIKSENITKTYNINNQDIGKVRHEYVAGKLQTDTDQPLSVLGVQGEESVLTPDSIDIVLKRVLELGTSRSESITKLTNEFHKKKLKYDYLLRPKDCNTYYLIVGYNSIVTNLILQQSVVDDLCARFRIGIQLETKITTILGYDIFSTDNSEDVRIAKAIFSNITLKEIDSSEFFSIDDIISTTKAPSNDDILHSRDLMTKSFVASIPKKPSSRDALETYLSNFKIDECQTNRKRITNVPMLLCRSSEGSKYPMDSYNSDMPSYLKTIWNASMSVQHETKTLQETIDEAMRVETPKEETKHKWKKESLFQPSLSNEEKIELALSGVGAKPLHNIEIIEAHQQKTKRSFHPSTDVEDIEEYIVSHSLEQGYIRTEKSLLNLIDRSKSVCARESPQISNKIWKKLLDMKMIAFFDQCSEIFTELSYNYKHWTQTNQFMIKETVSGIKMIIKNSGTHMFVSFAFPKHKTDVIDTGRIGPTIYTSNNYYYTEFSSFNEPTLEHFVKAGPYMCSLLIHLMSNYELEPGTIDTNLIQNFNMISLLYLNNKTDSEELLTSQRYLFMKLFEDATQDPYIFVDRLPEVLRSRLSVYLLRRTILLMDYYRTNRILKIPKVEGESVTYNYLNIKSLINHADLTLNQKINEFYFGYVISKEKGRGSDRNFKIVKKILQEEYKFRDSVKNVFEDMSSKLKTYATDPQLLRVFLHIFSSVLKDKIGNNFKTVILEDFLQNLSFTNFTQLATLKASARNHDSLIQVPENIHEDRGEMLKELNKLNKDEAGKRPKVLEALMKIVKQYQEETGHVVRHMMQLIPWCLKGLELKGYFDSDIFPKPQHGGDREIHVLEIKARIVQYTLELISRVICKYFMSETITHPETKSFFVKNHYKQTSNTFKSSFVMSKSADASKWCQRHHVSHFASMLVSVTHPLLHGFILRSLKLWTNKKISFPLQLSATLLSNKNVISNPTFMRFRDEFFSGTGIFETRMSNKITIKSGMMQGILHYTSSLYHTMIQEVMRIFVIETARKRFKMNVVCSIVQGSDDSGMMLGIEGKISQKKISNCYILFRMKEEISQYLSVYWNVCKSSIGTVDLIEYNSEWYSRMRSIKPTFRWISACMELNVTERFIDRIRIFNQVLTQCLEGGASTLECSIVQLNQAWLHYMMLGLTTSILRHETANMLSECHNPQLGFFPFDFDMSGGIPGVDCQLYNLSVYGNYIIPSIKDDRMMQYEYEGQNKSLVPKDMRSVKLRFGRFYLWSKLVERLNLGTLEDAIEAVQKDPMILFGRHTSWAEEIPNLLLKVFSPGVKESINNISSSLRMMAASAYILTRPCLSVYKGEVISKMSLYKALKDDMTLISVKKYNSPSFVKSCFPMHEEYEQLLSHLSQISKSHETFKQSFHRSSKETITVFEVIKNETDLIDLCKRKWNLGGRVTLSSRQFQTAWSQAKLKFPFLADTISLTAENLSMTYVELKLFLESLKSKERRLVLQDSPVKYGGIESAITRIYWPNVKIRSDTETQTDNVNHLRSNLFSVLSYWMTDLQTSRICQEMISKSKFLRKDYSHIPIKARKLKTIFDWSQNKSKIDLIQQIKNQKQGRIGFFSMKQKGWGNNKTGDGEWRGQVLGIPCLVNMTDNDTNFIKLRNLQDIHSLGYALMDMLSEFNCLSQNDNFKSNISLSMNGKITASKHPDGRYIPIIIDENLRIDIISSMEDMNWSMEAKGTTIRLILNDHSFGENQSYTILSDTFSQKDWNPQYTMDSPDLSLNNWCNNNPSKISMLEAHLDDEIPSNFSEFLKFNINLENKSTRQGWSLSKFRSRIISVLIDPKESMSVSKPSITDELPLGADSMMEINQVMYGISTEFSEDQVSLSNLDWSDDVIEHDNMNDFSINMTDEIKESINNLSEDLRAVYENPDKEDLHDKTWMKMSSSNRFFSNLDTLCEIQTGMRFYDYYFLAKSNDTISAKGLLGKILSLVLRRHVYQGKDTFESLAEVASESSRQVDTIMSEADLVKLDHDNLEQTINQLESARDRMSGTAQSELNKTISKYKRLLLLKMSPTHTSDIEDIDYGFFMSKVVNEIFNNDLSKFSNRNLEDNLKLSLVKIEMIEFLEGQLSDNKISNHEFTLMREYVNKNMVSSYLIETLNMTYGLSIDLRLFQQTHNIEDLNIIK